MVDVFSLTLNVLAFQKMQYVFKVNCFRYRNFLAIRRFSLTQKCLLDIHEPSAPKPDRYPKWASSPAEIFGELRDGNFALPLLSF